MSGQLQAGAIVGSTKIALAMLVAAFAVHCLADDAKADAVLGRWASDGSIIEVTRQGDALSAVVIAMLEPNYLEDEAFGPVGAPRRDDLNPDATLQARPIHGLELLSNYTFTGKRWEGDIYDPESGNTYASRMHVEDGELKMRGYIGMPMFGRTATFLPVSGCAPHVVEMLQIAQLEGC